MFRGRRFGSALADYAEEIFVRGVGGVVGWLWMGGREKRQQAVCPRTETLDIRSRTVGLSGGEAIPTPM